MQLIPGDNRASISSPGINTQKHVHRLTHMWMHEHTHAYPKRELDLSMPFPREEEHVQPEHKLSWKSHHSADGSNPVSAPSSRLTIDNSLPTAGDNECRARKGDSYCLPKFQIEGFPIYYCGPR